MDLEYSELEILIDSRIANSLERIANQLEFDSGHIVMNEVDRLRIP